MHPPYGGKIDLIFIFFLFFDSCSVISFKGSRVQFLVLSPSGNQSPSESRIGTGFKVA